MWFVIAGCIGLVLAPALFVLIQVWPGPGSMLNKPSLNDRSKADHD